MLNNEMVNAIVEEIKGKIQDVNVVAHNVIKNNDMELHGISIQELESNIAPTFYIENYAYDVDGSLKDMYIIANEIVGAYHNISNDTPEFGDVMGLLSNFEEVQKRLKIRLINKRNNTKLFETVPYMPFMDLAMICVVDLGKGEFGNASIKVTNTLLNHWGVNTIASIMPIAYENMKKEEFVLRKMSEILSESTGLPSEVFEESGMKLYVLTNESNTNGATAICNDKKMKEIVEMLDSDLIVLPSSIHEVIIMPKDDGLNIGDLIQMVQEINGSEVAADEILSNNVYVYSREHGWEYEAI